MEIKDKIIKKKFVMPPHPLTNFEIQNYYQNEPRFNSVCSGDYLLELSSAEIKDGACIRNFDENSNIGIHWVTSYVQNNIIYFDSFGVEHIPKEIKTFISNKNIKTNIFRIQEYDFMNMDLLVLC